MDQKRTPKPRRIARTAPKNFLNNSRGLPVITQGFEANRTRKFTRKFGEIFVAKVLWGTFSVENAFNCNGSPCTVLIVGARAGLLRNGQNIGPQLV